MKNFSIVILLSYCFFLIISFRLIPDASADWKIVYSERLINAMRQAGYAASKYHGSYRTKTECLNALARASTGRFRRISTTWYTDIKID